MEKQKILIVDDSEMNRLLLTDILEGQYDVVEAENGAEAVRILGEDEEVFWFVLLDIMMPEMDGFDVLNYINKHYWNDRVVVMMISSDDSPENINRAYNLGAFDYIGRPFDPMIVRKRIANTLFLYARQHDLEQTVKDQFYEQQRNNDLMISILSHIVEFRNGESGLHIQYVKAITELLLKQLVLCTDRYPLSESDITLISTASALHDVGKISIPEEILNKPGRLTPEEFAVMKTHSEVGAKMLSDLPIEQFHTPLAKVAYSICRWHHERYDGRGYPDGLKGEEIPIAAQVVALADVYDALTSDRCYKKAFSHEDAIAMILDGKCGAFNPLLLQSLGEVSQRLKILHSRPGTLGKEASRGSHQGASGYMQLLYVDSLTEIYNRRYYQEYIHDLPSIEALTLINVEHLEQINDRFGQSAGDLVLRRVAKTLESITRRNDHVVRYSGDKFLVVFHSIPKNVFTARLEEIHQCFDTLKVEEYPQLHISAGICGVYGSGKPESLFHTADTMLRRETQDGQRSAVCFLDETNSLNQED